MKIFLKQKVWEYLEDNENFAGELLEEDFNVGRRSGVLVSDTYFSLFASLHLTGTEFEYRQVDEDIQEAFFADLEKDLYAFEWDEMRDEIGSAMYDLLTKLNNTYELDMARDDRERLSESLGEDVLETIQDNLV